MAGKGSCQKILTLDKRTGIRYHQPRGQKRFARMEGENRMKSNQKTVALGAIVLVVLLMVLYGVWSSTRPATEEGGKTITVDVVHKDGSKNTFTYKTEAEYLEEVLVGESLVEGEEGQYGLYIKVVDGERADFDEDGAYWSIEQDGEPSVLGAGEIPVHDGDSFALVYTVG